ncbi:hypothetical protein ABK040_000622 [Willaertia magna]
MSMPKTSKLYQFINYRMRITLQDGRQIVGKFMAFDKFMNIVMAECEEFRKIIPKGNKGEEIEQKRTLGFLLIRGENIVSLIVEGPPPQEDSRVKSILTKQQSGTTTGLRGLAPGTTPGVATSASRGMPISSGRANPMMTTAPIGLTGPTPLGSVANNPMMQPMMGRGTPTQMNMGRGRGNYKP